MGGLQTLVLLVGHTSRRCNILLGAACASFAKLNCKSDFWGNLNGIAASEFRFLNRVAFIHANRKHSVKSITGHFQCIFNGSAIGLLGLYLLLS